MIVTHRIEDDKIHYTIDGAITIKLSDNLFIIDRALELSDHTLFLIPLDKPVTRYNGSVTIEPASRLTSIRVDEPINLSDVIDSVIQEFIDEFYIDIGSESMLRLFLLSISIIRHKENEKGELRFAVVVRYAI